MQHHNFMRIFDRKLQSIANKPEPINRAGKLKILKIVYPLYMVPVLLKRKL